MRGLDFTTWSGVLSALIGVALFALIGIGLRVLIMITIQQRRERMNRQINERLRTLIAAYKVLGGSFTGDLTVDPTHLRDIRRRRAPEAGASAQGEGAPDPDPGAEEAGSDRARRIRDAVEGALSDIILLGTEAQVRLAAQAARDLAAGRPVNTDALVAALRDFIRKALDLEPAPADLSLPRQGPARPAGSGGRGRGEGRAQSPGRSGAGGGAAGGGAAAGGGLLLGAAATGDATDPPPAGPATVRGPE